MLTARAPYSKNLLGLSQSPKTSSDKSPRSYRNHPDALAIEGRAILTGPSPLRRLKVIINPTKIVFYMPSLSSCQPDIKATVSLPLLKKKL